MSIYHKHAIQTLVVRRGCSHKLKTATFPGLPIQTLGHFSWKRIRRGGCLDHRQISGTFSFTRIEPSLKCGLMKNNNSVVVSDLLSQATINLNLKSADRDAVLAELVDQIPELAKQPAARDTLLRALHEREQLHSTGIGDGIALPHARNGLVGLVDHSIVVFGRHPTGIPYGAIDKLPTRLFFL